jgi:23S rRNA (adenine2503-C2)-methyltransferase
MIGVSVMSGCPIGCKFCATGQLKRCRNLTAEEIVEQIKFILDKNSEFNPKDCKEFKINFTRMGEPALNWDNVKRAVELVEEILPEVRVHCYISTIGVKGTDFSWIKGNRTLQVSLHSLDEERRNELIPFKNKMTIEELGQIRTQSDLKTTVNMTLVDVADFDINKLTKYFDPEYFFIKVSPINPNPISEKNNMGKGIIKAENLV